LGCLISKDGEYERRTRLQMVYLVTYITDVTNTSSIFKNVMQFHSTQINAILCTPTRKSTANFNKLVGTQHHYMQVLIPNLTKIRQ
jgi:hypothetical protein